MLGLVAAALADLETWGLAFGVVCVLLNVRQNIWCWPTGIVSVAIYVIVFYRARLYADMGLQVVYIVLGFYGWYNWLFGGRGRTRLAVSRLRPREGLALGALGVAGVALMGGSLARFTDAALPFWNSLTVAMSLIAQWLLTRKVLENWHVWIAADLIMIGIYLSQGLYKTTLLYAIYTGLAVAGLLAWRGSLGPP